MEILKSKATIFLVVMILSVAFIGGIGEANFEDNNESNIQVNA